MLLLFGVNFWKKERRLVGEACVLLVHPYLIVSSRAYTDALQSLLGLLPKLLLEGIAALPKGAKSIWKLNPTRRPAGNSPRKVLVDTGLTFLSQVPSCYLPWPFSACFCYFSLKFCLVPIAPVPCSVSCYLILLPLTQLYFSLILPAVCAFASPDVPSFSLPIPCLFSTSLSLPPLPLL